MWDVGGSAGRPPCPWNGSLDPTVLSCTGITGITGIGLVGLELQQITIMSPIFYSTSLHVFSVKHYEDFPKTKHSTQNVQHFSTGIQKILTRYRFTPDT